ncbi:TIGR04540 family protein [Neobacillus citreus]|uniref:TIGR04540 family protein n=1 Tax=Neobacillus citreus TaxID=2833578 RepID=A0A942T7H4_9BACI|nr:TIGR04540 family protein [Neobacillus citreus]MCH6265087.1 TIGR04540 family protein [Neobacillus citreus]
MELKLFHKTQRDLASAVNQTIDCYWDSEISEQEMIDTVKALYENNPTKFLKDQSFTKIIQQQCGKRRLEVVKKILNIDL